MGDLRKESIKDKISGGRRGKEKCGDALRFREKLAPSARRRRSDLRFWRWAGSTGKCASGEARSEWRLKPDRCGRGLK